MSRKTSVGIDIGTSKIRVMIAEKAAVNDKLTARIIGTGATESKGLRHGYIVSEGEVIKALSQAIAQAEKTAGVRVREAYASLGGVGLGAIASQGSVIISRADSEITDLDIQNAEEACEKEIAAAAIINRKVLHRVPIQFKIDGKVVYGRPHGMKGVKLEIRMLFITAIEQHYDDLRRVIEECGVKVADVVAAPLAASLIALNKTQKIAGCVLANIGAETVSIVVYENGVPVSLEVFPIGSTDITNDIALGFKIALDEAERIKLGILGGADFSRKKVEEIVIARLTDIFDLIEAHLKKIGRNGLLPAGIIITGGGAGIGAIEDLAKSTLKLPARIAALSFGGTQTAGLARLKDPSWSVVYGLCVLGLSNPDDDAAGFRLKSTKNTILGWIKQFLP